MTRLLLQRVAFADSWVAVAWSPLRTAAGRLRRTAMARWRSKMWRQVIERRGWRSSANFEGICRETTSTRPRAERCSQPPTRTGIRIELMEAGSNPSAARSRSLLCRLPPRHGHAFGFAWWLRGGPMQGAAVFRLLAACVFVRIVLVRTVRFRSPVGRPCWNPGKQSNIEP